MAVLDLDGLTRFLAKCKELFVQQKSIVDDFDSTKDPPYQIGDLCAHDDTLYVCIEPTVYGEQWDSTKWQATNLDSLMVKTKGEQSIDGNKTFLANINLQTPSRYKYFKFKQHETGTETGSIMYDAGDVTNVTTGKMQFILNSPKLTPDTETTGYAEKYTLPVCETGLNTNKEYTIYTTKNLTSFTGATSSSAGVAGLVTAPAAGDQGKYLKGDGTWGTPVGTTYSTATSSTLGLIKIGYSTFGNNFAVALSSGKAYVTVPTMTAATSSAAGTGGLVPFPSSGKQASFLRGDGTWVVPTDTTYSAGTGLSLSSKTFSLASSGVTAGSYGPTGDVTGSEGATIKVPYITVDAYGRVTAATYKTYTSKNTTYSAATADAYGLIKIGYTASGKNYPVALSSGKAYVNVPWENTTYTAGTGLSLSSGAFSLATSGATAGSYGMSAATTGDNNVAVNIPYITVDKYGRVTSISNKAYTSKNTTYGDMTGATSSAAGAAGLVPKPAKGKQTSFLRGDGSWVIPTGTLVNINGTGRTLQIRSGSISGPYNAWSDEITFPNSGFSNACLYVVFTAQAGFAAVYSTTYTATQTTLKVFQRNDKSANIAFTYVAVGY